MIRRIVFALLFSAAFLVFGYSQEAADAGTQPAVDEPPSNPVAAASQSSPVFGLGLSLAYSSFPDPDNPGQYIGWQKIALDPDIALGKFGIGLNLDVNFRVNAGPDANQFQVRPQDWIPDRQHSFLEIYLPKFRYIRYGQKGDPLYMSFGNVENGTLGNGFIVGGYDNTVYQPEQRVFGMSFDIDGDLFKFPYVGIETMVDNLASWDLMSGRLFVRPAAGSGLDILKNMQIGFTAAGDSNPHYYSPDPSLKANPDKDSVFVWGLDLRQPILNGDAFTLTLFGDFASQKKNIGAQIGLGGRILGFWDYLGVIRYVGDNFIPDYFSSSYDVLREEQLLVYNADSVVSPSYAGWLLSTGFSFMKDALNFNITGDGPFVADSTVPFRNPNLKAVLTLREGVLGGFALSASYEKKNIILLRDLIDARNAIVGALVSYQAGPAVISLVYNLKYNPYPQGNAPNWTVSSKLETSIVLF